ncbi:hypothetical protein O181_014207 [Austropuccinia psidii MF-1]|uniref:Secreted protein n=1 Tax=Austropuccinia psidii MF-1 TaxID=1389203 RepID=A0A9Q3GPM5_9BASI|nr:hypothetical protein [Austropuccinia psidii MF-1]
MPSIPVLHIQIPTLVLVSCSYLHTNPCACPGSRCFTLKYLHLSRIPAIHTQILMPVQVSNNSKNFLCWGRPQKFQKFLRLVQAPNSSHANPYACTGSQQFQKLLMLVQAPNASHAYPYACTGSRQFKQFLTPVKAPNASHNSLHH